MHSPQRAALGLPSVIGTWVKMLSRTIFRHESQVVFDGAVAP